MSEYHSLKETRMCNKAKLSIFCLEMEGLTMLFTDKIKARKKKKQPKYHKDFLEEQSNKKKEDIKNFFVVFFCFFANHFHLSC